jgi:putative endonuclease
MKITKKKRAYKFGLAAEKLAVIFLRLKGYRIIAERYRNPKGEIDILAVRGKTLAIVEVKARKNLSDCTYSITPWKQKKILGAVEWLMAGGGKIAGLAGVSEPIMRFDAIFIVPKKLPIHLKDAWRM